MKRRSARYGRTPRFALNAFVICRDTDEAAVDELRQVIEQMDVDAVRELAQMVKGAGQSTRDGVGMWSDSTLTDLVQVNDGFKPRLIGTPEQVAERIQAYEAIGVDLFQLGFLHLIDGVRHFGESVIPRVKALPSRRQGEAASPLLERAAN